MRRRMCFSVVVVWFVVGAACVAAQAPAPVDEGIFFGRSLHYTNRGIEFVYSKEHGGIERLTGVSATEAGCLKAKCHVQSCDTCHKKDVGGKAVYSVEQARSETACHACHPVDADNPDVHFKKGMKCMDCHTAREVHGDGVAYDTYMAPGFFDVKCEKCHADIAKSRSHTIHAGKLDCSACHTSDMTTCFNCHIDTRLAGGKDAQIERKGILFLVNHEGEVTLGNFLSYVYGNKTMITLAPSFGHRIVKEGRACEACHATANVKYVKKGSLNLFTWKNGEAGSAQGVVPVIEGMKWNIVYLKREDDAWVPLKKPDPPLVNFSGYCTPLSREQLARLERRQSTAK